MLNIALNYNWGISQLDVNNAFPNGLFMGSNKLPEIGTRSSALSFSLSALSHLVQIYLSLFTLVVMHFSISRSMLMI